MSSYESVKFLGNFIDGRGVTVDTAKVKVTFMMPKVDLMKDNGLTRSVQKIKSLEDALGIH